MSWCDDINCSPSLHCTGHVVCPFFRPSLVLFLCASQTKEGRKEARIDREQSKKQSGVRKEELPKSTRGVTSSLMQGAAQAYPSVLFPLYPASCSRFNLPWCSACRPCYIYSHWSKMIKSSGSMVSLSLQLTAFTLLEMKNESKPHPKQ